MSRSSLSRFTLAPQLKKLLKTADVVISIAAMVPKLSSMTKARFLVVERADAAPVVEDSYYDINSNRCAAGAPIPLAQPLPSALHRTQQR